MAAGQSPLDEQIQGQLMLALYRTVAQVERARRLPRLRYTLDEQLGIDLTRMLRDLEAAILRQDLAPGSCSALA